MYILYIHICKDIYIYIHIYMYITFEFKSNILGLKLKEELYVHNHHFSVKTYESSMGFRGDSSGTRSTAYLSNCFKKISIVPQKSSST